MKYIECSFSLSPFSEESADTLSFFLGEAGFDSFVQEEGILKAYINKDLFSEKALAEALDLYPLKSTEIAYSSRDLEDRDWNEKWENEMLKPLIVDEKLVIHTTRQASFPGAPYDILINPRMAFGTGHHATTKSILRYILEIDFSQKAVLDMGCGTGVLAILAKMRGARRCVAIDNDEWCVANTKENVSLNHFDEGFDIRLGDAGTIGKDPIFDVVLANINRNILLHDMVYYKRVLKKGGDMILSGFYDADLPKIKQAAEEIGFVYLSKKQCEGWIAVRFQMGE